MPVLLTVKVWRSDAKISVFKGLPQSETIEWE